MYSIIHSLLFICLPVSEAVVYEERFFCLQTTLFPLNNFTPAFSRTHSTSIPISNTTFDINHHEVVCPISRKPLVSLGYCRETMCDGSSSSSISSVIRLASDLVITTPSCYGGNFEYNSEMGFLKEINIVGAKIGRFMSTSSLRVGI